MNETPVLPAPDLTPTGDHRSKWEREYRAFLRLKPTLLAKSLGKYVAVHEEQVVGEGEDQIQVALRAYEQYGYLPIYVGLVSQDPQPIARVPSPRRI